MQQFKRLLLCFWAIGFASNATSIEKIDHQQKVQSINYSLRGDWSSGGGNAIVCFGGDLSVVEKVNKRGYIENNEMWLITTIEMYDLFEAKLPRGIQGTKPKIIEIPKDVSIKDFNRGLATRYQNFANTIFSSYRSGDKLLKDSYIRFHEGPVRQQNDIGQSTFIDKSRCVIQTMAVQRNVGTFFELFIDSRLFNHYYHSRQSKAALMLHEKIYAHSRYHYEHLTSHSTRKIVELMVSRHKSVTLESVLSLLPQLGYKNTYFLQEDPFQFNSIFQSGLFEKVLDNAPHIFNHSISMLKGWSFSSHEMWELRRLLSMDGIEVPYEDRDDFEALITKYYFNQSNISRDTKDHFEQLLQIRSQGIKKSIHEFMDKSAKKFIYEDCAEYSPETKGAAFSTYLHFLELAEQALTKYVHLDGESHLTNSIMRFSGLSNHPEYIAKLATEASLGLIDPFQFNVK
jgi:hypothetical protein